MKMIKVRCHKVGVMYLFSLQCRLIAKVDPDTASESCMFFVWPLDLVHVIDEHSPFYDISAADLARERFELLVIMEGTIETSSMNFQAR